MVVLYQQVEFEDLGYFGPDHERVYSFRVTVGDREFGVGSSPSKKLAKKQAALKAVNELFDLQVQIGKTNEDFNF